MPTHVLTDLFPRLIMCVEFVAILEKRETRQELVQLQELAELIQHVRVMQKVGAIRRAVALERWLDFAEHETEPLLILAAHNGRRLAAQTIQDVCIVLVIFIESELLQNITQLTGFKCRDICNALLLQLH